MSVSSKQYLFVKDLGEGAMFGRKPAPPGVPGEVFSHAWSRSSPRGSHVEALRLDIDVIVDLSIPLDPIQANARGASTPKPPRGSRRTRRANG